LKYREARAKLWTAAFGPYVQEFLAERTGEVLSEHDAAKASAIIVRDYEELKRLAAKDDDVAGRPELIKASSKSDHFELRFCSPAIGPAPCGVYVDERETDRRLQFPIVEQDSGQYIAKISYSVLGASLKGKADIHVNYDHAETRRVRMPANVKETTYAGAIVFRTVTDALSIDLRKAKLA